MSYNSETYDDVTYDTGILIGDVDLIESPDRFADIESLNRFTDIEVEK